jgi:hypothetical protein
MTIPPGVPDEPNLGPAMMLESGFQLSSGAAALPWSARLEIREGALLLQVCTEDVLRFSSGQIEQ